MARPHRQDGVGVPVVVTRRAPCPARPHEHLPVGVTFSATAVLRFDGPDPASATRLELLDPLRVAAADVGGRALPLAADLTTPLAVLLARDDLNRLQYWGFLRADRVGERGGFTLLEPYQPGKIPVLLVHGLLSSPLTWAPLFNDLHADPELRSRYQFWAYFYPSGDPFPTSAADLRRDLVRLRDDFDPGRSDAALDHMVLVGHSMGGLIAKMLTQDGGDDFWSVVSARPLDALPLSAGVREQLRRTFYFARQPAVERVVFLGTPHGGSALSPSLAGKLASRVVRLRADLAAAAEEMKRVIPDLPGGHVPTSVELLAPDATALRVLAARPAPPGVHYHSVVGVRDKARDRDPTDGVVPYRSAHLEGVESELVVPAEHGTVHQHPAAVEEVRRILREHLRAVDAAAPVARRPG